MKPATFAYARAQSVAEAVAALAAHGDEARLIAGGQSLVAMLNMRLSAPRLLIDINAISGLSEIAVEGDGLRIGALVRYTQALRAPLVARHAPLLTRAIPHIAHAAIRNRGTLGGSVAFADPAAEMPACILALGADIAISGPDGARVVAADDFFLGLYETALGPADMLTGLNLPLHGPDRRVGFAEFARRHGDYAMVGLAATATARGAGLGDVRLAYFSMGPCAVRARGAEQALEAGDLDAAVAALEADLDPTGDIHASRDTKMHLAGVLLRRVAGQLSEQPQ
ncbi:FAD binding domain-containing protein [Aquabacter spiritensis]|uniref:Carbon-monoxide dehydrogenase medium subunit n=1 Tax=Aquabacter spiritensis TaxID=933073 RepID=A0A4R3M324_9HYPH|nr:FAD binding domain-containing protein [Aquabacter spiritensis]TCT05667.1 carbon-monoxide dehydrogenase medium subunit [Aquabacter spiritensis]